MSLRIMAHMAALVSPRSGRGPSSPNLAKSASFGVGGEGDGPKQRDLRFNALIARASRRRPWSRPGAPLTRLLGRGSPADACDRGWKENREEWNGLGSDKPYHYLGSPR